MWVARGGYWTLQTLEELQEFHLAGDSTEQGVEKP